MRCRLERSVTAALLLLASCGGEPPAADATAVTGSGGDGGTAPAVTMASSGAGATSTGETTSNGGVGGVGGAGGAGGSVASTTSSSGVGGAEPPACGYARADVSSAPAAASWRYGGGVDYPDIVPSNGPCTTVVATRAELEAALAQATTGHVVYVQDDAEIDLTKATLCIPGGVTLASGRGKGGSPGAKLFTTTAEKAETLKVCGDDVRVTGLRLHGWDIKQCAPEWPNECADPATGKAPHCRDCMPASKAIAANGMDRLEVDNCEITGFSYAGVELRKSLDNHVHHNHIHHNQRQGLGYGVVLANVVDPASALIEWNRFDYNRHSVAGSGAVGHSYEARNNLVLPHANGHVFDMHGIDEKTGDGTPWAGTRILVHDNTVLPTNVHAVLVRGRPTEGSWTYANCLARKTPKDAAAQTLYKGNFFVDASPKGAAPNAYGKTASQCETVRFCASLGGAGPTRSLAAYATPLASVRFGDFDGNGKTDVFRADGAAWWWSAGGAASWKKLRASTTPLTALAFGDFDGDGKTDVFRADGTTFAFSSGGTSDWKTLTASSYPLSSLAFGDFDGDGKTDVLRPDGTQWWWLPGGLGKWQARNTSTAPLSSLAFGDFDGDGKTDAFRADGTGFSFSAGAATGWKPLAKSGHALSLLGFGDFDGDGKTDVLRPDGARWNVSFGGASSWRRLAIASEPVTELGFGDFDGDGKTDVFRTGCL